MTIYSIKKYKSLIESFFSLSILNGLNVLLPLVTIPYIIATVGISNFGKYSYVYVIIQYLLLINSYGFNYSTTKQIAQNRDDHSKINSIYNAVISCRIILFIGATLFFILISPLILKSDDEILMFFLGLATVLGDVFSSVWLFQGMERMRYMTIINFFSKILFTVLIFIVIKKPEDYIYIILLNSFGFILSGLLSWLIAKKQFGITLNIPTWSEIKFQFRDGFSLFGTTIGINLYRNANIFILNFFVSSAAVGVYATAEKVLKALQLATVPVAQALFPHLGYKFKNAKLSDNLKTLNRVGKIYGVVLLFVALITFWLSPYLIKLLGGELREATILVRIMTIVIFFGGMNYLVGMVGLVNLNRQRAFFIAVMVSGIISVLFLLSTVSAWGIKSGALSLVVAEIILFIMCIYILMKIKKKQMYRKI